MSPFSIPSSLLTCPTGNGKHDGKDKEGIYLHLRAAKNGAVFYPLLIEMESTDLQISNKLQIVCIPLTVPSVWVCRHRDAMKSTELGTLLSSTPRRVILHSRL